MRSLSPPPPSCTFFKHTLKVRAGARCTVQSGPTFYATNVACQDHSEHPLLHLPIILLHLPIISIIRSEFNILISYKIKTFGFFSHTKFITTKINVIKKEIFLLEIVQDRIVLFWKVLFVSRLFDY